MLSAFTTFSDSHTAPYLYRLFCHNHKDARVDTSPKFVFSPPRYTTTHLPGKYTATAIIEAYHLDAISHHSAPNWTVCLLHFHFPLSALSASLWDRPEKWHSLRLIEHPQAQTKLTEPHTGATHDCLDSLLLLCPLVKERRPTKGGTGRGRAGIGSGKTFYVGWQRRLATWSSGEICC